ncbi:MAG: arylsulfotransferase family protein [Albidovulum sp.]
MKRLVAAGRAIVWRGAPWFLVFVLGLALGVLSLPPAPQLKMVFDTVHEIRSYAGSYLTKTPSQHLKPRVHPKDGLVDFVPDKVQPGVTFMSGLFGNTLGFRLYANDGKLLHEWPIDFFKIAPDEMRHKYHALIHGAHLYPNGDVVANLDGRGIVRFDSCGNIAWRSDGKSHHSLDVADDGALWTPTAVAEYQSPATGGRMFKFDKIASFDPATGMQLNEIDLVASLISSDAMGLIQANGNRLDDVMHLNDVEILSAADAPAFPMFNAGDILLSSRNLFQLWVLDGVTHKIKWQFSGPLIGQHDPDFHPDGTITVLDNRPRGEILSTADASGAPDGSRILSIDPKDSSFRVLYRSDERNTFNTPYRGKHQILENGNILITETDGGRVFEVTRDGEVVWSFVNGWDETHIGWIMDADRYPESYGQIASAACK